MTAQARVAAAGHASRGSGGQRSAAPLLAVAGGLALADASVVTLALPPLLVELHTTVFGVAAVIGVYTLVLAAALLPAEQAMRSLGPARVGAAGFAVFGLACLVCGASSSLPLLLIARAVQAAGGAAALVATFGLLHGEARSARNLWLGAAVLSAAIGPAFGGLMTDLLSWRAIFYVQVPVALVGALVAFSHAGGGSPSARPATTQPPTPPDRGAQAALALVSAALSAVLFLLVLLLVAGWAVNPLVAALTVTVVPAAALAGSRLPGDPRWRAAGGCLLAGMGTLALAWLPDAHVAWTFAPQLFAGLGMGLALPALGGELLPERDAHDAAALLTLRHVGIAAALVVVAPIVAHKLATATRSAQLQGTAVVLDAKIDPTKKIDLAPVLLGSVNQQSPRKGLRTATRQERGTVDADQRAAYDEMTARADDILIAAVRTSFFWAFVITGAFAVLAALLLAGDPGRGRVPFWLPAATTLAVTAVVVVVIVERDHRVQAVRLADPCHPRRLPGSGGIEGFFQDRALELLDRGACSQGSTREELALAIADPKEAKRYQAKYGTDPRSATGLLGLLLGG